MDLRNTTSNTGAGEHFMKVRVVLTVDVDVEAWMATYGVARDEVRADVHRYLANLAWSQLDCEDLLADPTS